MAIKGKFSFNGYSVEAAYAVIGRMNISDSSAIVYFNVYASLSAYMMGSQPISTFPLPMDYALGDVPADSFELQALSSPIFTGFERTLTAAISSSDDSLKSLGASILS
ncbi:hypothetical protein G3M83_06435 [Rouxiella badensis]|uniref:hypothetical protein n=1 Tax=Rouxiella badensis TaxID=1646377 RepID=UPI0013EF041B|nr:hypothetical protein [Rouxiella badensis]QII37359.1 hypothetical protein G3M83_06435 [Rouxiella badensis]